MDRWMNETARRVAVVLVTLSMATTVQAQRASTGRRTPPKSRDRISVIDGRTTGFMLGVHTIGAPGVSVTGGDIEGSLKTGFGPGAGFMVGYGFNRTFSAFASIDLAKQDASAGDYQGSFGLRHMEIGGRANLPLGDGATVPYLTASIGQRALGARVQDFTDGSEYTMKLSGGMFGMGGGVEHSFSPTLAMDSGLEIGFGRFGHYEADGDSGSLDVNGTTTVRLRFGVTWRPSTRRSS